MGLSFWVELAVDAAVVFVLWLILNRLTTIIAILRRREDAFAKYVLTEGNDGN